MRFSDSSLKLDAITGRSNVSHELTELFRSDFEFTIVVITKFKKKTSYVAIVNVFTFQCHFAVNCELENTTNVTIKNYEPLKWHRRSFGVSA